MAVDSVAPELDSKQSAQIVALWNTHALRLAQFRWRVHFELDARRFLPSSLPAAASYRCLLGTRVAASMAV